MKKIISLLITLIMIFASFPTFAEENAPYFSEDFNSLTIGAMPKSTFYVKCAGDADMGVVEEPDVKNKSLYIRSSVESSAYIERKVSFTDKTPITLSFRFMAKDNQSFSLPAIVDSLGNMYPILEFKDMTFTKNGETVCVLSKGVWHYFEIKINFEKRYYRISCDGDEILGRTEAVFKDIAAIRFESTNRSSAFYLDDIMLRKSDIGGAGREYYPSEMYMTDDEMAEISDILLGSVIMHKGSNKAYKNGSLISMPAKPQEIDKKMYAPLRFACEVLGGEVVWNEKEQAVFVMYGGKTIKLKAGYDSACIDGKAQPLSENIVNIDGSLYIAASDAALLLNQPVYTYYGLIMLGNDPIFFINSSDRIKNEILSMVRYQRPTGSQMYTDLTNKFEKGEHPRIFATADDFERIRTLVKEDEFVAKSFAYLKQRADEMLDTEPCEYEIEEGATRLLGADDVSSDRIEKLSFVYQVTGEAKYADRAYEEMAQLCSFNDWNPTHFLDTGNMMRAMSVGFDWLYHYMSDSQRALVRQKILDYGIMEGYLSFVGTPTPEGATGFQWVYNEHNWNAMINLGMLAGCVAICDEPFTGGEVEKYIIPTFGFAMKSLELHFNEWDPDGGWVEGPGYSSATIYHDARILSVLLTAMGTDYGIVDASNFTAGAYYQFYMFGPAGDFNYGDAQQLTKSTFRYEFLFAKLFEDKSLGFERKNAIEKAFYACEPTDIIWYDPQWVGEKIEGLEMDKYFRRSEVVAMRSAWDNDGIFAGFMAGDNKAPHSQYDTGNFVLDWEGTRWASDLGMDHLSYTTAGTHQVYRGRAEGHNTLVINETPYLTFEGGEWPLLTEFTFDELSEGDRPTLDNREQSGVPGGKTGTVQAVREPLFDNPDNMALEINVPEKMAGTQVFTQLRLEEPYPVKGAQISFKVQRSDMEEYANMPEMGDGNGHYFTPVRFAPNGKIQAVNGSAYLDIQKYTIDTWYDIAVKIDIANKTYDLYIDGVLAREGLKMNGDGLEKITYIRFQMSNKKVRVLLDDFAVKVHPDDSASVYSARRRLDQVQVSKAYIDTYVSKERGAMAITDMTEAYAQWATKVKRGAALTNNRSVFMVRDEVVLREKSDIYWFSHMPIDITAQVNEDGKSTVLTDKNGNRMWVGIISDTNVKMEIRDCTPLPGSPNPSGQQPNSDKFHKITIKAEGVEKLDLTVAYIPLDSSSMMPDITIDDKSLDAWEIPDGEIPSVDSILLGDTLIEGFEPEKTIYNVTIRDDEQIPMVKAQKDGEMLSVNQASAAPGTATFTVEENGEAIEFKVNFTVRKVARTTIQGYPISEDNILTSSIQQEENPPKAVIDGNDETRWAAQGSGEWIILDFEEEREFSKLNLGWYLGEKRNYKFEIQLSSDGANWRSVFKGTNSKTTGKPEEYAFETQKVRYIKIICNGNNENMWNNIAEIQ